MWDVPTRRCLCFCQEGFTSLAICQLPSCSDLQETDHPPVLLIDGYNILFAYSQHLKETNPRHDLATSMTLHQARDAFNQAVITYSKYRQTQCVIVYDAMKRKRKYGPSSIEEDGVRCFTQHLTCQLDHSCHRSQAISMPVVSTVSEHL